MPIYEFECRQCRSQFEELVRCNTDLEDVRCSECGSGRVERTISLFGFSSKDSSGQVTRSSAGGACAGCGSGNCGQCQHH